MSVDQDAIKLHKKHQGKIEIVSKVPLKNKKDLSLAYTPGVAAVSKEIAKDKNLVNEYTNRNNTVAIVSDGRAVLGLGDIGPEGALPVMEGKAILFKEFAGIDGLPLCIAETESEKIIAFCKAIAPTVGAINL